MSNSPWAGFTELEDGETVPEPVVVEMGRRIEAGANLFIVEDKDENDPPGACADGASYIIAAVASGTWTGHEGKIATAVGTNASNGWLIRAVSEGVFAYVRDENALYRHNGSVWGLFASGSNPTESIIIAASDETTAITTGTAKTTFRMPYAFTLTAVRASVGTAPTGSTIIIDINEAGSTILSTKLSIDAGEKTSTTAASAAVISDTALADDAEITIDFDQVGSTIAGAGVKVYMIGSRA